MKGTAVSEVARRDLFGLGEVELPPSPAPVGRSLAHFAPPSGVTERQFREIVGAAYTAFTGDGVFPSIDRIKELCRVSTVTKKLIGTVIDTQEFKDSMDSRGVPWKNEEGLTGQQMYCLQILTNPTDRRELGVKLRSAGATHVMYRAWLKQPHFSRYLNQVSAGMLVENIPVLTTVLTNRALGGDLNAIKYAFEISGHHDPNKQEVLQLQQIMQQLIEIITRNVKDPEVLTRISNELHFALVANNVVKGELKQ